MKVFKYQFQFGGEIELEMPKDATVLHVDIQSFPGFVNWVPCLWALVHEEAETETRRFRIIGTGQGLPEGIMRVHGKVIPHGYVGDGLVLEYVGTFQEGPFVWHLWERTSK